MQKPVQKDDDEVSVTSSERSSVRNYFYNWRLYVPATGNLWHLVRWLMVGGGKHAAPPTDKALLQSLEGLALCLILLRKYLDQHGMPPTGGARDQEYVLREVIRDLYAGGTPLWALQPVMQKTAEGLTVR